MDDKQNVNEQIWEKQNEIIEYVVTDVADNEQRVLVGINVSVDDERWKFIAGTEMVANIVLDNFAVAAEKADHENEDDHVSQSHGAKLDQQAIFAARRHLIALKWEGEHR